MIIEEISNARPHLEQQDFERLRGEMVKSQLVSRGIKDLRVLDAMSKVPREIFIPPALAWHAYSDSPLPIGDGQTISQPFIVAFMAEALALEPTDRVLEVGTGLGYAAAVMSHLCDEVFTVERLEDLAMGAEVRFEVAGIDNVSVHCGDGSVGLEACAPFQAISVAAACPTIPLPLMRQLDIGGRLIMPLGPRHGVQALTRITRLEPDSYHHETLLSVRFVPLL